MNSAQPEETDLHRALVSADALETFERLPVEDQEKFTAWIEKARDEEARWRRIDILVLGMRMAPRPSRSRAPKGLWTDPKF